MDTYRGLGFPDRVIGEILLDDNAKSRKEGRVWKKQLSELFEVNKSTAYALMREAGGTDRIKAKPAGTERARVRNAVAASRQKKRERRDASLAQLHDVILLALAGTREITPGARLTRVEVIGCIADFFSEQSDDVLNRFIGDGEL